MKNTDIFTNTHTHTEILLTIPVSRVFLEKLTGMCIYIYIYI
jgi:hypothetical protein